MLNIGIVAGEASGDLVAADLMRAMRSENPALNFVGIAGSRMIEQGCHPIFTIEKLSVMGVVEVLQRLPELWSIQHATKQYFKQNVPDVFIGIDAPDFNLPIERFLRQLGVPTVHYNSPTVWAWRKRRIHTIAQSVSLMLTLFPFEAKIYQQHAIPVKFIGHPLADNLALPPHVETIRDTLGISSQAKVVALLPGSRLGELKQLAALFVETAKRCYAIDPDLQFVMPFVNEACLKAFREQYATQSVDFPLQLSVGNAQSVIAASDAVLVASGTATLEVALLRKPMVVAYRLNWLNYQIAKLLIDIPYFSLPNLLLNQRCVPEFFQQQATPETLTEALMEQLALSKDAFLFEALDSIKVMLKQGASEQAARAILDLVCCT